VANNATTATRMTATASMMIPSHQPRAGIGSTATIARTRLTNSGGQSAGGQQSRTGADRSESTLASVGPAPTTIAPTSPRPGCLRYIAAERARPRTPSAA